MRVDSNLSEALGGDSETAESDKLKEIFASVANESIEVEFGTLSDESVPALLSVDEELRRMEEMMRMYGIAQPTPPSKKLLLNSACPLIKKLDSLCESDPDAASDMAGYIYKLALLSQKKFTAEEMQEFMQSSYNILMKL